MRRRCADLKFFLCAPIRAENLKFQNRFFFAFCVFRVTFRDKMAAAELLERLKGAVKDAPDFPRPGILFKDIMPVFQDPKLVWDTCEALTDAVLKVGKPDVIIGIEARGFLIGPIMAQQMGLPFVAIRKKGKLPRECFSVKYEKEYGVDEFDMQKDALKPGQKVVVVDDLLATGGTLGAAAKLCDMAKATVIAHCVMFEVDFLKGRERLTHPVVSLVR